MGRFEGRGVFVAGGSGGMGRAAALELAKEGAAVAVHYRTGKARAESVAEEIHALSRKAVAVHADLSDPAACRAAVREAIRALGHLDGAVAFAGHPFRREDWFKEFETLSPEEIRRPIDVDLLGSVHLAQAVLPELARRPGGSLVLIGSTPALTGDVVGIPYLIAKAGILALTRSLAQVYGPKGVRVNALALGSIATEAMDALTQEEKGLLAQEPALKRWGTPEEVARVVAFLLSEDAAYITGATLVVDGGYALR